MWERVCAQRPSFLNSRAQGFSIMQAQDPWPGSGSTPPPPPPGPELLHPAPHCPLLLGPGSPLHCPPGPGPRALFSFVCSIFTLLRRLKVIFDTGRNSLVAKTWETVASVATTMQLDIAVGGECSVVEAWARPERNGKPFRLWIALLKLRCFSFTWPALFLLG